MPSFCPCSTSIARPPRSLSHFSARRASLTSNLRSLARRVVLSRGCSALWAKRRMCARRVDAQVILPLAGLYLINSQEPACAVTYVLESEPSIRLVLVGCRLSRSLRKQSSDRNLPLFDFWRSSLRRALDSDPFWGPPYAKEIEVKAAQLEQGLLQLIQQSCELSDIMAANDDGTENEHLLGCPTPYHAHAEDSSRRKLSILAKQQIKTKSPEEQGWMRKVVVGCWTTLLADAARARITRLQTCPEPDISAERRKSTVS